MPLPATFRLASGFARDGEGRMVVQGIGAVADTLSATGAADAPVLGATVVLLAAPPAGIYSVTITAMNSATAEATAAGVVNARARKGAVTLADVPTTTGPVSVTLDRVTLDGTQTLNVVTIAAGIAGSRYIANIQATRYE